MMPTLTTTIQHSSGSFGHSNQSRKRNKRNPDWKRRNKTLTVFADDMILNIETPKDATRKLLELINEYSKVAGYKINTHKKGKPQANITDEHRCKYPQQNSSKQNSTTY